MATGIEKRRFNSTLTLDDAALSFIYPVVSNAQKWRSDDNEDFVWAFRELAISLES